MDIINVAIVTNVIPNYRSDFYRRIFDCREINVQVFCQQRIPGTGLETIEKQFGHRVTVVPFWSLKQEALCWQVLPFRRISRDYDIIFLYGNPRIISNILCFLTLKWRRKKIVVWGLARMPGRARIQQMVRIKWWAMFDGAFVYSDREAAWLKKLWGNEKTVIGMNNGLDQEVIDKQVSAWPRERLESWRKAKQLSDKVVVSVARLTKKPQLNQFMQVLPGLVKKHPDLIWIVIGTGPEAYRLEEAARVNHVEDHVRFWGAVYSQDELCPLMLAARALVHPGCIGLTILHAFGYGLPVVTHNNETNQSAEFAAFEDGINGLGFPENDASGLSECVDRLLSDSGLRDSMRTPALRTAREVFNTQVMADRFKEMVRAIYYK